MMPIDSVPVWVWLGESLPMPAWTQAKAAIADCDVLFAIGTSELAYPAAKLPVASANKGLWSQVNRTPRISTSNL